ncbi:AAA domain-containing protein [Clostridium chrysemydis]|uniref:AAA domain-containing protein n=1 Tax=Clostridium chrysemydis TaxID=2665504 RepID=UPI001884561C
MNERDKLVLIKGEDKTKDIHSLRYDGGKYFIKFKGTDREYGYSYSNVEVKKAKDIFENRSYIAYEDNIPVFGVKDIVVFDRYIKLIFEDERTRLYEKHKIRLVQNELKNKKSKDVFSYLKELSKYIVIEEDKGSHLFKQYDKIQAISKESILSNYLNKEDFKELKGNEDLVYPFSFNISQKEATEKAFSNRISVIEGPPGTGKTQTILNIIANAYINNKTVCVVSNNNSATSNVIEKLEKYGVGFIAAFLGNAKNKEAFIEKQIEKYPNMSYWNLSLEEKKNLKEELNSMRLKLDEMLEYQNSLAKLKEEREEIITEHTYFNKIKSEDLSIIGDSFKNKISKKETLKLLIELEYIFENEKDITFIDKIKFLFKYKITSFKFYKNPSDKIFEFLQSLYYEKRLKDIEKEIDSFERKLERYDFSKNMKDYSEKSMKILKSKIVNSKGETPPKFELNDLKKNFNKFIKEYPVILSTTHSIRSCITENYLFDYVIIDESSQVDIVTGALAFSCAKNVVIVGDLKQLPNVVPNDFKKVADNVLEKYNISKAYSYADESLLSSITKIYPKVSKTLLKEHYRCNNKIIGYCNKKFYNGELVILTKNKEEKPLVVYKTAKGNHASDKTNLREIEVIKEEVIPNLKGNDSIGIISPYRNQVEAIKKIIKNDKIEVDTVHKYQGREKDVIILSTVSNEVNNFVDDDSLINVAVSRAVSKLAIVVSSNESMLNKKSNIGDLVKYVRYNNYEVLDSNIHSVFDLLYSNYKEELLEFVKNKKVSKYDSENILNVILEKILEEDRFKDMDFAMHEPLKLLLKNTDLLNEEELKYAMHPWTHTDFIIFDKYDKSPILVIEVDGYSYHDKNEKQLRRDKLKDSILEKYNIKYLRLNTKGSKEEEKIIKELENAI